MSSAPPLLSAATGTCGRQSRSASKAVVKAASGYHEFRIEGYLLTKTLPGGERISSQDFTVGGRSWRVDFYPNGTDSSKDKSDSIALYLVYLGEHRDVDDHQPLNRLMAEYKFSLLDHAGGNAAYELPAEKGVFKRKRRCRGCGHDTFIRKAELEGRHARMLLKDNCLAIRCDVGVVDQIRLRSINTGAKRRHSGYSDTPTPSSGFSDTPSSSYRDTESSSYSDDSCFGTDSDDSRSPPRRRNKRRRMEDREYALQTFES